MKKISGVIICALFAALLIYAACKVEGGGGSSSDGCGSASEGCVTGNIVNANSGSALADVIVSIAGTTIATANTQGYFFADNIAVGSDISICFSVDGFAETCRTITIVARKLLSMAPVEMQSIREQTVQNVDTTDTDLVDATTGARVELTAGSICQSDRTTQVTGDISCALTPLDVTGGNIELAPGDFSADNGTAVELTDTSAMMNVECTQNDEVLDICEGSRLVTRLPIYGTEADCFDASINPDTLSSWAFATDTGIWNSYDVFARQCGPNVVDRYYTGFINRLGWWNAGVWYQTTCLRGNVNDGFGAVVPGAEIRCRGVDYQGMSYAYSTDNATFCTKFKPNAQYSCVARKASFTSDPVTGTAPNNTNTCGNETSCANIGQIDLTNPLARAILSWGEEPSDLDTHFVGEGVQIYFNNKDFTQSWQKGSLSGQPFILLDTDDTTGFGPEMLTIVKGVSSGSYYFCVHNFSGQASGGMEDSGAVVQYFTDETSRRFEIPTSNPNNYNVWRVFKLEVSSSDVLTVTEINEYADGTSSVSDACEGN